MYDTDRWLMVMARTPLLTNINLLSYSRDIANLNKDLARHMALSSIPHIRAIQVG